MGAEVGIGDQVIFVVKQETSYDIGLSLVGSDICIRDRNGRPPLGCVVVFKSGSVTKPILESLYTMCKEFYNLSPETTKLNSKFLKDLQTKCHEYWKISENYTEFGHRKM